MRRQFRRRQVLGGIAALASAGAVAGCSAGGGNDETSESPSWPSYVDDATDLGTRDARGSSDVTVDVSPDGGFAFEPTRLRVDAGTTVDFAFRSGGHNVKPNSQPEGGGLAGTEGGEFDLIAQGERYSVTLETTGLYTYYCGPHEGSGMKGAISVE